MEYPPTKCRAIIRTRDGKRYMTRWFKWKSFEELAPDELDSVAQAMRAAQLLAKRRSLRVQGIDAQFWREGSSA